MLRTVSQRARQSREIGFEAADIGKREPFAIPTGGTRCGGFCLFYLLFVVRADGGGTGVLRLDDRTLHVLAGGFLGIGLGGTSYKGGKTSSPFGWMRLDKYV